MSLEEFVVYGNDFFQFDMEKFAGEDFPCCVCRFNRQNRNEKPCRYCNYNDDAVECYNCSLCGDINDGNILIDSNIIANGTRAEIGGICDTCLKLIKLDIKGIENGK